MGESSRSLRTHDSTAAVLVFGPLTGIESAEACFQEPCPEVGINHVMCRGQVWTLCVQFGCVGHVRSGKPVHIL